LPSNLAAPVSVVPPAKDERGEGEDDGLEAQRSTDDPGDGAGAEDVDDLFLRRLKALVSLAANPLYLRIRVYGSRQPRPLPGKRAEN
jgi:hypothetical protein